ncbi:MAG: 2-C-methyl-D-erythritol 4-phosphate cytidylyltransferase [Actinobacteria bacterium]|nr:2-C-methyl-D-erythritol 4-phosphate cytidylyltransferase [Actinomycetota bacterium]
MTTVCAIVVAAGRGERLGAAGAGLPKALVQLAEATLLEHAVRRLAAAGIGTQVVVHTPGYRDDFAEVLEKAGIDVTLVPGGASRSASVRAGFAALRRDTDVVAIHDAARALTPTDVIARTLAAIGGDVVAAAPGLPVADTLKHVADGAVRGTLPRDSVWAIQTPQVVRYDVLATTLEHAAERDATDDLALVEAAIAAGAVDGRIRVVSGDARALKITGPGDLAIARDLLAAER